MLTAGNIISPNPNHFFKLQIKWENRYINDVGNNCLISVDGIDFKIREPCPFVKEVNKNWFSHKFKRAGLRYEVGICIRTGHVVWLHGPFPCGKYPDLAIFNRSLANCLDEHEMVEADRGYKNSNVCRTPGPYDDLSRKM